MADKPNTPTVTVGASPENPAAFPSQLHDSREAGDYDPQFGMTLRDWFAGQWITTFRIGPEGIGGPAEVAKRAYAMADFMLTERERKA